jgi:putative Mg2+ transporter-C (MgtC) family protein
VNNKKEGVAMHWSFLLNIAVALALGIAIGLERQWRQHQAGLRTNALVALGAALFVSLTHLVGDESSPTRIASYVVSSLGFLGGGVIIREGLNVRGLNTAATLWCSGAVGTLAGAGFPLEAAVGTLSVLAVNLWLRPVVHWIDARTKMTTDVETYYRLRVTCADGEGSRQDETHIRAILLRHVGAHARMSLQGITTEEIEKEKKVIVADLFALERNDRSMEEIVARLSIEPEVKGVSWERGQG